MTGFGPIFSFWVLAMLTVVSALSVMLARTIIHAVLFLILFFVALAAMFVLLSADFLAVAQLLVYAGAIGVLVVFAVLLTPPREYTRLETLYAGPGLLVAAVVIGTITFVAVTTNWATAKAGGFATTVAAIGQALMSRWVLPFEIASVLLLAAMVGAIVLVRGRGVDQALDTNVEDVRLTRRER